MTSKNSFYSINREQLKRYLAVGAGLAFVCLLQILAFVIELQNIVLDYKPFVPHSEFLQLIKNAVQLSFWDLLPPILFGIAFAYAGFGFLHIKAQVDFYGSLPLKRSTYFRMNGLDSTLLFGIASVILLLGKWITLGTVGCMNSEFGMLVLIGVFCQVLAFLASWVTAVLCIILTGQWFVALLAYGVIAVYMPLLIRNLIPTYAAKFFYTYVMVYDDNAGFFYNCFSPISLSWGLISNANTGKYLIAILLGILIIGSISYLLFKKRPGEAAGRAMTFEKINPVIRFLIVIPLALYGGWLLDGMSTNSFIGWNVAGIIISAVVLHGLVEVIYQSNIRALFAHKLQMVATVVCCLGILAVFYFDWTGYDAWIPESKETKSIEIIFDQLDNRSYTFWGESRDGISGDTKELVLDLVKESVIVEDPRSGAAYSTPTMEITYVNVTYHMDNGKIKKRRYQIDQNSSKDLVSKIYESKEFKENYLSLYTADLSKITKVEWDNMVEYETVKFNEKEKEEFIKIYLSELDALSYEELCREYPVSEFQITCSEVNVAGLKGVIKDHTERYYIYPSFEKTLSYLEDHGVTVKAYSDYEIKELTITKYLSDGETERTRITDVELIQRYEDQFIYTDLMGYYLNYGKEYAYSLEGMRDTSNGLVPVYFFMEDEVVEQMLNEI